MNVTVIHSQQETTLASRLRQAPLTTGQVLRVALQLADALRRDHERGVYRGVLDPAQVVFSAAGAAIADGAQAYLTPYASPEALEEQPADARSDVFVFGSLVYHLLAGRTPFPGETPEEIRHAILSLAPEPVEDTPDNAGLIGLLGQCLEKNPELRWQRMQKVYMELKLLSVAVRRSETDAGSGRAGAEFRLREELDRVERALTARIGACDQSVVELQRTAATAGQTLDLAVKTQEQLYQSLSALERELAAVREATQRLEAGLVESSRTIAAVENSVSGQVAAVERQLTAQAQSIEALHTTMAQTDDLLERVVESFDSLQSFVLDRAEAGTPQA